MTRALAALFLGGLTLALVSLPVVVLAWTDVLEVIPLGTSAGALIFGAATAQGAGVVYLARVPEPVPRRRRHQEPKRPGGALDPRSFRIFVRVTVAVIGVAALLGAVFGVVGLLEAVGR